MKKEDSLIPAPNYEIIVESGADTLLSRIRPQWQAKKLIDRVKRILPVDPSSACQRIFNACIHDLKEKLTLAGVDISSEAAKQNKLPPISKAEDIEKYTPYNTIELSFRVGLLSKAESRRLFRVYDIRGDLEHEDHEYEATVEDCIYVFKTCVECVLSRDPIEVIRLIDIKEIVEQPTPVQLSESVLEDYKHAPIVRQLEIHKFLISNALNNSVPDIVRQNCYMALGALQPHTQNQVFIDSSKDFVKRIGRKAPDLIHARVAYAAGIFPYLKKSQLMEFFKEYFTLMEKTGYTFRSYSSHGELLRNFADVGGFSYCPDEMKPPILEWLILLYIGEPGGYGMGIHRKVFYSNVGAPLALKIISESVSLCQKAFKLVHKKSKKIKSEISDSDVARRFETIVDIFQSE